MIPSIVTAECCMCTITQTCSYNNCSTTLNSSYHSNRSNIPRASDFTSGASTMQIPSADTGNRTSFFKDVSTVVANPTDEDKRKRFLNKYGLQLKAYGICVVFIFFVWRFLSSGDWSFILTLASIISMCSFLMVALYMEKFRSCQGISVKMLEVYLLVQSGRLVAIVPFDGYLPYDRSGDYFYQMMEAFTFCLVGLIVFLCRSRYKHTYDQSVDRFSTAYMILPAILLSLVLHPNLNNFWISDVCWAMALYLEAVAALPQLFMFQREAKVYPWTAHFLAAQAMSKACNLGFWLSSYQELHDHHVHAKSTVVNLNAYLGYWVLIVQGFQLLIMGDFLLQYTKCVGQGISVAYMLNDNV